MLKFSRKNQVNRNLVKFFLYIKQIIVFNKSKEKKTVDLYFKDHLNIILVVKDKSENV